APRTGLTLGCCVPAHRGAQVRRRIPARCTPARRMHRHGARRHNNVTRFSTRKPPFRDAKSAH
ncbi:hypothetical protein, partial [Rubrivivax gelatinosus]|uniref:hypothetical protein n=1 Tax=Rubrivivax gelatinosus TaxID=28068 RepID=UPI001ED8D6F1